jgi:rhodanese-related sulfurtransferase
MQKLSSTLLFATLFLTFILFMGCDKKAEGSEKDNTAQTAENAAADNNASEENSADEEEEVVVDDTDTSEDGEGQKDPNLGTPVADGEMSVNVGPTDIESSDLLELMQEEPELQLLDVRTPGEVAGGIIEGAKVINFNDADFADRVAAELDNSKPVAIYCASGIRSAKAIPMLKEKGFTITYNLAGGTKAWTAEGNKLSK